jgi:hypothetical protein
LKAVTFGSNSGTLFSSAAGGWQLEKWKDATQNWAVVNGRLQRNRLASDNEGGEISFPLPARPQSVALKLDRIMNAGLILARNKANPEQALVLALDSERPGCLTMGLIRIRHNGRWYLQMTEAFR